ncbi:hypothetical protein OBBRIDRAFT_765060 [Obba rivulosa]|uniref:Uncharacterized protein n=1 Tax=Obba rivulosa TaxID=1052685 RepID=A0A8E2DDF1_9APHY|nr:hypothetical protein OBBRIDRAFT_765060 [Obba rivulosa]
MKWRYNYVAANSLPSVNSLVHDVILAPDFDLVHFRNFRIECELASLDSYGSSTSAFSANDGWQEASVTIKLPKEGVSYASEVEASELEIHGIQYRPILDVLKAAYQDPAAAKYHYNPFKMFWQPDAEDGQDPPPPERVYSEIYNSDAMIDEDRKIQDQLRDPGDPDDMEYAVAPIMLWSDSTHLANFGTASLWPIYLYLGNESKYSRCKPSAQSAQHLAYIPSIPDVIQDVYRKLYGITATALVLTFCKRELFQAIWLLLLDAEFIDAYLHGFVLLCADGIKRRLFPRILTYSADYPEKILIACIRFLAQCPCPTCHVEKSNIASMGNKSDMKQRKDHPREDTARVRDKIAIARKWVFECGYALSSKRLGRVLDYASLIPIQSAFSQRLSSFGFNHYSLLVPDLLHEFELGVWKAVFTHLMRILYAAGGDKIQEFN